MLPASPWLSAVHLYTVREVFMGGRYLATLHRSIAPVRLARTVSPSAPIRILWFHCSAYFTHRPVYNTVPLQRRHTCITSNCMKLRCIDDGPVHIWSSSTKFHLLYPRWIETCHCDKSVVVCLGKNEWQETPVAVAGTWKLETDIRDAIVITWAFHGGAKFSECIMEVWFNTEIWRIILQSKRKMVASWPSIFTLNIILTDHPTLCRLVRGNCHLATSCGDQ